VERKIIITYRNENLRIGAQYAMTNQEKNEKKLEVKLYNNIEDNFHIAKKKALVLNCRNYYEASTRTI
jgi:hypothetical protein